MSRKRAAAVFFVVLAPIVVVAFFFVRQSFNPPHQIDVFGELPDFQLTESSGQPISLAQLRGHIWIANFIFTNCPTQCPMITAKMKHLQDRLVSESQVRLVSFTVDPERDTPAVLATYADKRGADRHKWFFVTGPQRDLNALNLNGFRLGDGGTPTAHSFKLVLVDSQTRIRGYYDGLNDQQVELLGNDALTLLHQTTR